MRLRTLGGLSIDSLDPAPPLGPRRLGLLALVAAAGRSGVSRDRILGILWAESSQEQARHTLSQTLYSLRREVGEEWIVASPELRLAGAHSSDVGDLKDALSAGDHATVAALYSGPFLDGFYLPGAAEFERWAAEERARLHAAAIGAVEQLAIQAGARSEPADAITWWTRLTELDPLSSRFAAGRMQALAAAGDRASALAHARVHTELVRRELDSDPDPAIRQLVHLMKEGNGSTPTAAGTMRDDPAREPVATVTPAMQVATETGPARERAPSPRIRSRGSRARRWVFAVVGAAALLILALPRLRSSALPRMPSLAVGTIAGAPLGDSVAPGPLLRDMLSASLAGVPGLRVVNNARVVELMAGASDSAADAISTAARRAGANEVLEGELSADTRGLVLTLRRVALDGSEKKTYVIRAADRFALVDNATAAIARDLQAGAPTIAAADLRTSSPAAYSLYEEGLRAYFRGDGANAAGLMRAALDRDTMFVMAAYYAWQSGKGIVPDSQSMRDYDRARRLAPHAIERERLTIQGALAAHDAPLARSVAIAETLTVRYPSDPDGQILLGQVRTASGEFGASVAAFERAYTLDSVAGLLHAPRCRVCAALGSMSLAYIQWDSAGAAERTVRRLLAVHPEDRNLVGLLVEPLLREGRRRDAERVLEENQPAAPVPASAHPMFQRDLIRWGRHAQVDAELEDALRRGSADVRGDARWLLTLSLRDQGRLREADALGRENRIPGSAEHVEGLEPDSLGIAIIGLEAASPAQSARIFRGIAVRARTAATPPGYTARVTTWMLTLAASAHAAAGDTAQVRRLVDSVEVIGRGSTFGRDLHLHHYLRGVLLQAQGRHAEAVEAFSRSLYSVTDGFTRTNLAMARSLLALGRASEAIIVLRPAIRGGVDGSNSYVSRTEVHESLARAFEMTGQGDSAAVQYRAVERAWRRADPEFRSRYLSARAKASAR